MCLEQVVGQLLGVDGGGTVTELAKVAPRRGRTSLGLWSVVSTPEVDLHLNLEVGGEGTFGTSHQRECKSRLDLVIVDVLVHHFLRLHDEGLPGGMVNHRVGLLGL